MLRVEAFIAWYRIPDARDIRVNRANLTRFTLREPLWDAWCDSIGVLIRVLAWAQPGPQMASPGRASYELDLPAAGTDSLRRDSPYSFASMISRALAARFGL